MIRVNDLHKDHPLIQAAHKMAEAHAKHATLLPAVEEVQEQFPQIKKEQLMVMWIAINAKDLETIGNHKEFARSVATGFFYWWHNQPGTNTQQGFEQWWSEVRQS